MNARIALAAACGVLAALGAPSPGSCWGREGEPDRELRDGMGEEEEAPSGKYLEMLNKRLKLSPAQRGKIKTILDGSSAMKGKAEELKKLRERMKALSQELRAARREVDEKIRAELDAEQRDDFDELRMRLRMRMREGPGPGRRGMDKRERWERREKGERDFDDPAMRHPPEMWQEGAGRPGGRGGPGDQGGKPEPPDDD